MEGVIPYGPSAGKTYEVVLVSWNRTGGVRALLHSLEEQDLPGPPVRLINNNIEKVEELEDIVGGLARLQSISVSHNMENMGCMARFLRARESSADFSVFLDDDQVLTSPGALSGMLAAAKRHTLSAWWSWDYQTRYVARTRVSGGNIAKHCGPGGMVADNSLFRDQLFWDRWEPRYYPVDDVWVSCFAKAKGWDLRGYTDFGVAFQEEYSGDSNAMFKSAGMTELKQELADKARNSRGLWPLSAKPLM